MLDKADDLENWSGRCSIHSVQRIFKNGWRFRFHNLLLNTIFFLFLFLSLLITTLFKTRHQDDGNMENCRKKLNALKCHWHSLAFFATNKLLLIKKRRVNQNNHWSYDVASHNLFAVAVAHTWTQKTNNWFRFFKCNNNVKTTALRTVWNKMKCRDTCKVE